MADAVEIRITAVDGSSQVFKAIGRNATDAGTAIDKAGKDGSRSLDQMGKSAQRNSSLMDELRAESTAVGAAIGTMVSGLALAGAAFRDQERQVDGIERAYGEASDTILEMAEDIQDLTRYSNDAARESALMASSLASNYDLGAEQIQVLIERSADLAQIYGYSLPDAVERTSAALRGEGEAAEKLGLNMSDAAMAARALEAGIVGWSVPGALTEAEKAAFRFQVFLEDSAYAAGAAADAADDAGGTFRQFANEAQDALQAVGGFAGPVGEIAAEMAPLAIAMPIVGAGLGNISRSALAARASMAGLALVTSPITLGLTAIAGVGALVVENMRRGGEAAENYEAALASLGDTIEWLRLQNDDALADMATDTKASIDEMMTSFEDLTTEGLAESFSLPLIEAQQLLNKIVTEDFGDAVDIVDDVMTRIDDALRNPNVDQEEYLGWINELLASIETTAEGSNADEVLQEILTTPLSEFRVEADAAIGKMEELKFATADFLGLFSDMPTMLDDLRIGGEGQLAGDLEALHTGIVDAFTPSAQEVLAANSTWIRMLPAEDAQAAIAEMTRETELSEAQAESLGEAWERISSTMQSGNIDNAAVMADVNAILADTTMTAEEQATAIIGLSSNLSQYVDQFAALKQMQTDWLAEGQNFLDWWQAYDQVIIDTSGGIAEAGDAWLQFRETLDIAADVDAANQSFDQVLRTFDQIDQLASRPERANSIATALIGEPGEWSVLDDLLESQRIEVTQYHEVLASGQAIIDSAANSQLTLNEIRADQLPLLEQETLAYEQNLTAIAAMEPVEQRRALMLQDTAVQSQVAALYSQAYAASIGEIPESVATQMILNAADADAGLKDLLLNLGLISETDGEIRVNFPGADESIQAIDRVTGSVLMLADLLDNNRLDGSINLTIEGDEELNDLYGHLLEVDSTEAEATVTADTSSATTALTGVDALRADLDGASALVSVFGDNSDAQGDISTTQSSLAATNGMSALITIAGDNSDAMGAINEVSAFNGANLGTAVFNVVTQYSSIGSAVGNAFMANGGTVWTDDPNSAGRWGGLAAANGRTVMVGEAGPEMVTLPHGSQVMPHAASMSRSEAGEAGETHLHLHIDRVYGIDDLTAAVFEIGLPALAAENSRRQTALGLK